MGGGIGIPPMVQLAKDLRAEGKAAEVKVIAGYRDGQLFLKEDMEKYADVYVATEDGSVGVKGNVMDVIAAGDMRADIIMACGPMPMLRAVPSAAFPSARRSFASCTIGGIPMPPPIRKTFFPSAAFKGKPFPRQPNIPISSPAA